MNYIPKDKGELVDRLPEDENANLCDRCQVNKAGISGWCEDCERAWEALNKLDIDPDTKNDPIPRIK